MMVSPFRRQLHYASTRVPGDNRESALPQTLRLLRLGWL